MILQMIFEEVIAMSMLRCLLRVAFQMLFSSLKELRIPTLQLYACAYIALIKVPNSLNNSIIILCCIVV